MLVLRWCYSDNSDGGIVCLGTQEQLELPLSMLKVHGDVGKIFFIDRPEFKLEEEK